jgi:hypothetical protein
MNRPIRLTFWSLVLMALALRLPYRMYRARIRYSASWGTGRHSRRPAVRGVRRNPPSRRHRRATPLLQQLGIRAPGAVLVDAAISVVERVDASARTA